MTRVFISGPYTQGYVMENIRRALFYADWLLAAGYVPFVPHLTGFWDLCSPHGYEAWLAYDMAWLQVCNAVLRIEGISPGADKEVAEAERLGIPVFRSVPEIISRLEP
jgi:hypothetical protein